jgi:beta-glucosidase
MTVPLTEGADVGYRWFGRQQLKPMYAFGYGLSYTRFAYSNLKITGGQSVSATVTVRNVGARAGADVPQLYLQTINGQVTPRLLAFTRVSLAPGESREVTLTVDPRLLANYDDQARRWRISQGRYAITLARAADDPVEVREITLRPRLFGR